MKRFYLLLALIFAVTSTFAQVERRQGSVEYKKRNANGKIYITPGANADIVFNDSLTLRYTAGTLKVLVGSSLKFTVGSVVTIPTPFTLGAVSVLPTGTEFNYVDGVTSAIQTQFGAKVDTGRTIQRVIGIAGAKIGATAGWAVAAASNISLSTLPASQTSSTLIIPITYALKVGSRITGFSLIGQVESAGNTATITADLRKQTAAAADVSDASVGAMAAPASFTADGILSATNASKTGLTETVGANETFYVLITGTTAASTDIAIQGIVLNLSE